MKNFLCFVGALGMLILAKNSVAQNNELPKYQRSTLSMVSIVTNGTSYSGEEQQRVANYVENSFKAYPFPSKYDKMDLQKNNFTVDVKAENVANLINKINQTGLPKSLDELNALKDQLGSSKYLEALKETCDGINAEQRVAHQLIMKWFNIKEDGSFDANYINERACFNASMTETIRRSAAGDPKKELMKTSEKLLETTFVSYVCFETMKNEPYAALMRDILKTIAPLAAAKLKMGQDMAIKAAIVVADKLYEETKDGYSATSNNMLYRLNWNDSVAAVFYDCFNGDKLDMNKFNATNFTMEFVGTDRSSKTVLFSDDIEKAINKAVVRNLDKQFVKLANNYEVFAPMAVITSVSPKGEIRADIGTKEGIKGGDKYEVLEATIDAEGNLVYQPIAKVKVDKKNIWDNEFDPTAETQEYVGSVLLKSKKAMPGMVVRQIKKK